MVTSTPTLWLQNKVFVSSSNKCPTNRPAANDDSPPFSAKIASAKVSYLVNHYASGMPYAFQAVDQVVPPDPTPS